STAQGRRPPCAGAMTFCPIGETWPRLRAARAACRKEQETWLDWSGQPGPTQSCPERRADHIVEVGGEGSGTKCELDNACGTGIRAPLRPVPTSRINVRGRASPGHANYANPPDCCGRKETRRTLFPLGDSFYWTWRASDRELVRWQRTG